MSAPLSVAVAPNFHLHGALADRLLIADGAGWRPPCDSERSMFVPQSALPDASDAILLFTLPGHLLSFFWGMLKRGVLAEDFDTITSEVARFLTFKQLPPPERAIFELVLHGAGANVEQRSPWAVMNLGDDPILVGLRGLRLRLGSGEGIRLSEEIETEFVPPDGDAPDVLLLVSPPQLESKA
jgi:hypothetical protein